MYRFIYIYIKENTYYKKIHNKNEFLLTCKLNKLMLLFRQQQHLFVVME